MSEVKLEILNRFNTLHEANIALSFLKSNDIDAIIFDEHTVNIYATPGIFNGVRLMVPSHQLEQARKLIIDQQEFALDNPHEVQGVPCPKCKSTSTEITNVSRKDLIWLVLSFIFVFPMFKESKRDWHCLSCQNEWTAKSSSFEHKSVLYVIQFLIFTLIALGVFFYIKKN